MKRFLAFFALLLVAGGVMFLVGRQTSGPNDTYDVHPEEMVMLKTEVAALKAQNEQLTRQNAEAEEEVFRGLMELLGLQAEKNSLKNAIEELEGVIAALNRPPASLDSSSPWERFTAYFQAFRGKDWDSVWDFHDSEFKQVCPKDRFVKAMSGLEKNFPEDPVFIDEAAGRLYAKIWFMLSGEMYDQELVFENGEWFIFFQPTRC